MIQMLGGVSLPTAIGQSLRCIPLSFHEESGLGVKNACLGPRFMRYDSRHVMWMQPYTEQHTEDTLPCHNSQPRTVTLRLLADVDKLSYHVFPGETGLGAELIEKIPELTIKVSLLTKPILS